MSLVGGAPVLTGTVGAPAGSGSFNGTHGLPAADVSSSELASVVEVVADAAGFFGLLFPLVSVTVPNTIAARTVTITIPTINRRRAARRRAAAAAAAARARRWAWARPRLLPAIRRKLV